MAEGQGLSGVYCIRHLPSGARYVGSSKDIAKRWRGHLKALQQGTHTATKLLTLWGRDGASAFAFEVLEACDPSELRDCEQSWINDVPEATLLNVSQLAKYSSVVPEIAAKIAARLRGRPLSAERRAKISAAHKGRSGSPRTDEWREHQRLAATGRRHSSETRNKISAHHWSRSDSVEAIKIRLRLPRKKRDRATVAYLCGACGQSFIAHRRREYCSRECARIASIGRRHSDETRAKIRASAAHGRRSANWRVMCCQGCGRAFETKQPTRRYCTSDCAKAYHYRDLAVRLRGRTFSEETLEKMRTNHWARQRKEI